MVGAVLAVDFQVTFSSLLKLLQVTTILATVSPCILSESLPKKSKESLDAFSTSFPANPEFDDIMQREFEATIGQTVLLPCTVRNVGDRVVSWIRSKDLHILTSAQFTFSSDSRFEPVHSANAGDFWGLRIRGVDISDTGQYECQVNTDPKMSLAIKLTVSVPGMHIINTSKWVSQALIKGPSEVYVLSGNPLTLTCEISPLSLSSIQSHQFFTSKPEVRWLHNGKDVFFQNKKDKKAIFVKNDYQDLKIISRLHLSRASLMDSGQYTCIQPSMKPDTVKLHVIENGEEKSHSEAMQRDFPLSSSARRCFLNLVVNLFVLKLLNFMI